MRKGKRRPQKQKGKGVVETTQSESSGIVLGKEQGGAAAEQVAVVDAPEGIAQDKQEMGKGKRQRAGSASDATKTKRPQRKQKGNQAMTASIVEPTVEDQGEVAAAATGEGRQLVPSLFAQFVDMATQQLNEEMSSIASGSVAPKERGAPTTRSSSSPSNTVSLFGIGGKKTKADRSVMHGQRKRSPGEIRIQKVELMCLHDFC